MKISRLLSIALGGLFATTAFGQFTSNKVGMLSRIPLSSMPGSPSSGAGCTGYVSPNGKEYAIMGVRTGTVIVDVSIPRYPVLLNLIPGSTTLWHENAVLGDYAYLVSDSSGNGMQIVSLVDIDNTRNATLVSTYSGNNLSTIHTIQANPQSKTLFLNGSNRGLVFLDVTNPTQPVEVGRWTTRYVHDSVPVNYTTGPWAGREILFACCGSNGLYILDVTSKATPVILGSVKYLAEGGYCHSGVLSADKKYFLVNDEFDEGNGLANGATTHIIDVQDLANPFEVEQFNNPIQVVDHNSTMQDGFMMLAAYRGGLRIYNPTDPLNLKEIGYFDTYPGGDAYSYDGAWGTFAGFPSGNVVISDINRGLFMVDPSEAKGLGAPIIETSIPSRTTSYTTMLNLKKFDGRFQRMTVGDLDLTFQSTSPSRETINLTFTARRAGSETAVVQIKNLTTGQYVNVINPVLTTSLQTFTSGPLATTNYMDSTGKFYVRIKVNGSQFASMGVIDMVRSDVE